MSHHSHDHHSHKETDSGLSFKEKGEKLVQHWLHHNEEHARSYSKWASEFRGQKLDDLADLLDEVVDLTQQINHILERAENLLSSPGDR